MKVFDASVKRWLFAFTHPDDEISIVAWIKRLVDAGAEVWVGWSVTNSQRQAEGMAVTQSLGVPKERLFFFEFPDKGAFDNLDELSEKWGEVIERAQPERIALGAFECGHIDHDSTNFAVRRALEKLGRSDVPMLEIPFYHTYLTRVPVLNRFAEPTGEEVLELRPEEWALKKRISKSYPGQNIGSLLVWYTLLGWLKGRPAALCRTERMRVQEHFDYGVPNLPEPLKSKVMASETWKRWIDALKKVEK